MSKNPMLIMLIGVPGSGKSTYTKNIIMDNDVCVVSRDEIRFSMLNDNDNYFAKEEEVYKTYIKMLGDELSAGYNVIADSTNLTEKSRQRLIRDVEKYAGNYKNFPVYCIVFTTPLEECIRRNNLRAGRAHVPEHKIREMYEHMEMPKTNYYRGHNIAGQYIMN